ncbi:MAG TPA: lipopolysaccharide heptosyltransferase II [Pyrinomonadaceae bacterium]|nr:lipopolysaccharide heptosyltransferase II [Pyrinomonadaceae bacterium]
MSDGARVVVRGANWVGDAVMTVPALRELRRLLPSARLTLATRAWASGLFAGADFLDDILTIDDARRGRLRGFAREVRDWRARRFDLAILFPNAFAPALVARAAGVPFRVGHATDGRSSLLTHAFPLPEWHGARHESFYYLNVVAELEKLLTGGSTVERSEPRFDLRADDDARRAVEETLRASGARAERPLVALCPGSTNSRAKRWPAERFAALGDMLAERAGAEVVLVGSEGEREISDEVARRMRVTPVVMTGRTTLAETAALLSFADLLVTNDTGPAHLADALGRPVVVIFGPTNPLTTRPYSPLAEVVRVPPECAPCMLRDCPIDHRCMTAVTPEDVFARASRILKGKKAA